MNHDQDQRKSFGFRGDGVPGQRREETQAITAQGDVGGHDLLPRRLYIHLPNRA